MELFLEFFVAFLSFKKYSVKGFVNGYKFNERAVTKRPILFQKMECSIDLTPFMKYMWGHHQMTYLLISKVFDAFYFSIIKIIAIGRELP